MQLIPPVLSYSSAWPLLQKARTLCLSHRGAVVNERWRARGRAWSRSQEHEGVVTYIESTYVRLYIDYLLQSISSTSLRALHAVPRASANPVDVRAVVAALHRVRLRAGTRRLWRSNRAPCLPRFLCPAFFHRRCDSQGVVRAWSVYHSQQAHAGKHVPLNKDKAAVHTIRKRARC